MMRISGYWLLSATVCLAVPGAARLSAQVTAKEKAVFAGIVRDSVTGQGIAKASIHLISADSAKPGYLGTSGENGAFRFEVVEPGDYGIEAMRRGYEKASAAELEPGLASSSLRFAGGQSVTGAAIAMDPDAVISGRVTDADGESLPGQVYVSALAERWQRGTRIYAWAASVPASEVGEYRLILPAGKYYVAAVNRSALAPGNYADDPGKPEMHLGVTVYPNGRNISGGAQVEIRPGQQLANIDFKMPVVRTYHVRGVLVPPAPAPLLLLRAEEDVTVDARRSVPVRKDGSFDFAGLEPGRYLLEFPLVRGNPTGQMTVIVADRDVSVKFPVFPVFELKGRIRTDGSNPAARPLVFQSLNWQMFRFNTRIANESFSFPAMGVGRYVIAAPDGAAYYVKSISCGERRLESGILDLSNGPPACELDVLLATDTGEVQGSVRRTTIGAGAPPPRARPLTAVLARADGKTGDTGARGVKLNAEGLFKAGSVPPGRYYVWASERWDEDLWQNMDFVNRIAALGVRVEVTPKETAQAEPSILTTADIERAIAGLR